MSKETGWNPKALERGPRVLWSTNVGFGYSNVAIEDNRLYTMGRKSEKNVTNNVVYSLDARSGKLLWKYSFESIDHPQSTPAVYGEYVYTLSKNGIMVCLNKKNGSLQWSKDIVKEYAARVPWAGFAGSPIVVGETVVLTANSAGMGLNKNTGTLVWSSSLPTKERYYDSTGIDYSTPVIYAHGDKQYAIISGYNGVYSVDVETGEHLWHYDWGKSWESIGNQVADPLCLNDKLFIVEYYSGKPGAFLLDIGGNDTPKLLWTNNETNSNNGSPVAIDGYIYVCKDGIQTGSGSLRCLDGKIGNILWSEDLERKCISLSAADGKLIILDGKGRLYIADASPDGCRELSRCALPDKLTGSWWTPPVLCNGKIYCKSSSGALVCIDVSK
jgi:outer membrane protein assembly factor BamB